MLSSYTCCFFPIGPCTTYPVLSSFCGVQKPTVTQYTGSYVLVVFTTDATADFRGFRIKYYVTTGKEQCDSPLSITMIQETKRVNYHSFPIHSRKFSITVISFILFKEYNQDMTNYLKKSKNTKFCFIIHCKVLIKLKLCFVHQR